ncbi:PREDICTED: caveolin-3-like [Nicrophorus vespilloides]|uniref:Caveolin n=1 Tax=Nicrophorus vespilloides TaxID=110193 RepID=A0ABM1ME76_NICVS|nr:PREDICTED: caveolin-3-like [Nicrophorus vespilloides]
MSNPSLELEDRDPKSLSQHLQVSWEDVIGEPDTTRSPECAWRISNQCFVVSRNCCYIFMSVIIAPCAALCLGCSFACLAFKHIWCWNPCLRVWKINCSMFKLYLTSCSQATIVPLAEAIGHCCSSIKVRTQSLPIGIKEDVMMV